MPMEERDGVEGIVEENKPIEALVEENEERW